MVVEFFEQIDFLIFFTHFRLLFQNKSLSQKNLIIHCSISLIEPEDPCFGFLGFEEKFQLKITTFSKQPFFKKFFKFSIFSTF